MKVAENILPTCNCRIERSIYARPADPKIKAAMMPVLQNPEHAAGSPTSTSIQKEREEFYRKMAASHEWREQIFARPFTLQPLNLPTSDCKTEKPSNMEPTNSKAKGSIRDLKWTLIGGITGSVIAATIAISFGLTNIFKSMQITSRITMSGSAAWKGMATVIATALKNSRMTAIPHWQ